MSCTDLACSLILVKPREVLMKFNVDNWSKVSATIMAINKTKNTEIIAVQLPMTNYFYLDALPKKIVVGPGSNIELTVNLAKLTEQRIYYDTFTVVCKNDCHHEIQLEADPQHKILNEIPRVVDLGHVPLGYLATEIITISPSERKIGFLFIAICSNPDFAITPTRGIISDKPVKIKIFYKPTAYITFRASVQVYLPSIMSTPLCFTVSAYTAPGYERDKIFEAADKLNQLESRHKYYIPGQFQQVHGNDYDAEVNKEVDFNWQWYRSKKVFFEKPDPDEKLKYELLGPLGRYLDTEDQIRRLRENEFTDYIADTRNENNATNIHNSTKLSSFEVFDRDLERLMEWDTYMNLLKPPINWATITGPQFIRQRTVDYYNKRQQPQFTDRIPTLWFIRYVKMIKFIDAGRKIILRNRLLKVLSILRQLTKEDIEILESEEYHEKVSEEITENNEEE